MFRTTLPGPVTGTSRASSTGRTERRLLRSGLVDADRRDHSRANPISTSACRRSSFSHACPFSGPHLFGQCVEHRFDLGAAVLHRDCEFPAQHGPPFVAPLPQIPRLATGHRLLHGSGPAARVPSARARSATPTAAAPPIDRRCPRRRAPPSARVAPRSTRRRAQPPRPAGAIPTGRAVSNSRRTVASDTPDAAARSGPHRRRSSSTASTARRSTWIRRSSTVSSSQRATSHAVSRQRSRSRCSRTSNAIPTCKQRGVTSTPAIRGPREILPEEMSQGTTGPKRASIARMSDVWPLFGLRIDTPRITLRYPDDDAVHPGRAGGGRRHPRRRRHALLRTVEPRGTARAPAQRRAVPVVAAWLRSTRRAGTCRSSCSRTASSHRHPRPLRGVVSCRAHRRDGLVVDPVRAGARDRQGDTRARCCTSRSRVWARRRRTPPRSPTIPRRRR